jgi:hypothetical protein
MSRRALRPFALLATFCILVAGDCEIDLELLNKPGTVTVTNTGTEVAVLAIVADDVKSYPTLPGGASASVETNVGGDYQVRVVMTPENTEAYRQHLVAMRRLVEKQIDGSASPVDKTRLFLDLAGIKAAIQALEQTNAAGCSGRIKTSVEEATSVTAVVNWVPQGDAGFWEVNCSSN